MQSHLYSALRKIERRRRLDRLQASALRQVDHLLLARQLGLSRDELRDIHVSAQLHDVGKIGIHDAILQKPGALTDEEFEIMKTHAAKGAEGKA